MADETEPPRKTYGFKERSFPRDNAPASQQPPAPTAQDLAKLAGPVTRQSAQAAGPKAGDPNDIQAALARNRAVEQRHGFDAVEIREVKSRRRRDYLLLLVGGNVLIVGTVLLLGANVVSVLFGFGGVILFSLSLTWIMWQVMGRY